MLDNVIKFHLCKRKYLYRKKRGGYSNLIKPRYAIHSFLLKFIAIDRIFDKRKVKLVSDNRVKTDKPIIFAVTHVGGFDIESAFEGIKTPAHLLLGDPKEVYMNVAGLILYFNGVICIETGDKLDRKIGKERCIQTLKNKGNILMFPEGAWNISPNQIVYYMYTGAVEMAIEADAQIIPVSVLKEGKTYYVRVGRNIDYANEIIENKLQLTQYLRESMIALQYETMLNRPILKRESVNEFAYDDFVNDVISNQTATYCIDEVYNTRYNPRWIVDKDEVFDFLKHIQPNINNAFLFNKRLK